MSPYIILTYNNFCSGSVFDSLGSEVPLRGNIKDKLQQLLVFYMFCQAFVGYLPPIHDFQGTFGVCADACIMHRAPFNHSDRF